MSAPADAPADARARVLGPLSLLALGLNGVVGVGIFFLPATLAAQAPGLLGVAVLAATALALAPVALTFAALARRFDVDGGPVVYARAAFGDRAAFAVGWISFLSAVASSAAVLSGLCRYSIASWYGLSGLRERAAAAAVAAALTALSAAGLGVSARVWSFLTILKLSPLLSLVAIWLLSPAGPAPSPGDAPLAPSAAGLSAAALAATFAYQGFEVVPLVAGHARASGRAVPRAMLASLLLAAGLYGALHLACLSAVPALASSKAPLPQAAAALGGPEALLSAGANLSALGIAFGMVTLTPRYLAALGPDLGASLAAESPRGVPLRSVAVAAALTLGLLSQGDLAELLALSSVAVLAQYGVTALSLLRLASRRLHGLAPRDAWPAPLALLSCIALISGASRREALVAAVAVALGFAARAARGEQRAAAQK